MLYPQRCSQILQHPSADGDSSQGLGVLTWAGCFALCLSFPFYQSSSPKLWQNSASIFFLLPVEVDRSHGTAELNIYPEQ